MSTTEIGNYEGETISKVALRGKFGGVTYFMTTLKMIECESQLRFEDTSEKKFSDRIQRTLNKVRAEKIYSEYLNKKGIRIFNSLVVVLMPSQTPGRGFFEFIPFTSDGDQISAGQLKMKTDVDKIVVDGQHRLHAIKKTMDSIRSNEADPNTRELENQELPVMFLTFDEAGGEGFNNQVPDLREKITGFSRSVFTALNKMAKKADKNTILIVDDRDFSAVCARYLLEKDEELERYTKWHAQATSLSEADYFYTTIDVISDACTHFLGEKSAIAEIESDYDLTDEAERNKAIDERFLARTPKLNGLTPSECVENFYEKIKFFGDWRQLVESALGGKPALQPQSISLSTDVKQKIKEMRMARLLATVQGQKALVRGLIGALKCLDGFQTGNEAFIELLARTNKLAKLGLFDRSDAIWDNVLVKSGSRAKFLMRVDEKGLQLGAKIITDLLCKELPADFKLANPQESLDENEVGGDEIFIRYAYFYDNLDY